MKSYKLYFCLFIAFAMLLVPLSGCNNNKDKDPTADSGTTNTTGSAITFSYSDGIDDNGLWEGVKALDYVEMYDYNAFPIPSSVHVITDEALQSEIDSMLQSYSTNEQITNRAVVKGDNVNIDYVGSVDGVEFDGGSTSGSGTDVVAGDTQYIDDFLDQIIGHMPGETFNVNVTFPEDYGQDNLNGKDAVFVTTINYISNTVVPELTDSFVADNLSAQFNWTTVSELRAGLSERLEKSAIQNYIGEYFTNDVVIKSVPEKLLEYQNNAMKSYFQTNADNYGMSLEEFLTQNAGVSTLEELTEANADSNTRAAKFTLVVQAVAENANITVSTEDVADYFKDEVGAEDYSGYEQEYGLPYLKQVVLNYKVMNFLEEHIVKE